MKKILMTAIALLAISRSIASAEGINLSWNDCGTSGDSQLTFDCATNSGTPFPLIASFIPPPGLNEFLGLAAQISMSSSTGSLPDWWKHGTTECRSTSGLSVNFNFLSAPVVCTDFWQGQAVGGFQYDVNFGGPNRARLIVQCAVPIDNRGPAIPTTEYAAFRVSVQRSKSSGTGTCTGCLTPICIVLNSVQLFQPPEALYDPEITNPANANFVTWQASSVPGCPLSTPAHATTWGHVKSLYR